MWNYRCKKLPNHNWINLVKLLIRVFYMVNLLLKL